MQPTPYTSLSHTASRLTLIGPSSGTRLGRPGASRPRMSSRSTETEERRFLPIYCYLVHVSDALGTVKLQAESVSPASLLRRNLISTSSYVLAKTSQRFTMAGPTVTDVIIRKVGGKSAMVCPSHSCINEGRYAIERRASSTQVPNPASTVITTSLHSINYPPTLIT